MGNNGTGKTSILEALAVGVGAMFLGFDEIRPRPIDHENVRRVSDKTSKYPASISCQGVVNGQKISWTRSLEKPGGLTTYKQAKQMLNVSQEIQNKIRQGEYAIVPLVAYYNASRFWSLKTNKPFAPVKPGSRTLGYKNCFNPTASEKDCLAWYQTRELVALQKRQKILVFEDVKTAISSCVDNWQNVMYDLNEYEQTTTTTDTMSLLFILDDGIRNLIALVADMAYRSALLNPQLELEVTRQTPGIVLIDEIDLHLDTNIQEKIVESMKNMFPMIQFIVSSHSPIIANSVKKEDVIKC